MRTKILVSALAAAALAACGHSAPPPQSPSPAAPTAANVVPKEQKVPAFGAESIDGALRDAWKAAGVTPAPRADDATFIRRGYVDVVGTVPPPEATAKFIADASPDKRKKLVEELLASPAYAEHWMNYWDDVLMGRENKGPLVDRMAFRYWLRARFEANAPWDRMVKDLVAAKGQNSVGGPKTKGPGLAMQVPLGTTIDKEDADELAKVNGAVNWTLRFEQTPQDLAGNASRVFLGVQIQCAQCHDHKTEKWKQDDFRKFASGFLHQKVDPIEDKDKKLIRRVELVDSARVAPRFAKNAETAPIAKMNPTALDGTDLAKGEGTRQALASWMTAKENPWFAKAFVNRMWGHFLGRGFVDPVDDIRPSNPATMPELLDKIAADFAAHDFDIKHLIRTITATEAYQASAAKTAGGTDPENKLWARFHLVPLGPEELLNALIGVTGVKRLEQQRMQLVRQYAFLFEVDETDDTPDYSGTVSQALALLNGSLTAQGAKALPASALAGVLAMPGDDAAKVDALSLRVLSRPPTDSEREKWVGYVKKGGKKGYEDVLWAMLNSSEFVFNH
jgi:hypothetical protein